MGRGLIKSVNSKAILLDNILAALEYYGVTFCKDVTRDMLGGEGKLLELIAAGEIEAKRNKPSAQSSKWQCPAHQVARHCLGDGAKTVQLDRLLSTFERCGVTFSKDLSRAILGGEKKLRDLIAEGKVVSLKKPTAQNCKWRCSAAQVLRHCRDMRPLVRMAA